MEPAMEEKLKPNTGLYLVHILTAVASAVKTLKFYLIICADSFFKNNIVKKKKRVAGVWKNDKFFMADDFDATPECFYTKS